MSKFAGKICRRFRVTSELKDLVTETAERQGIYLIDIVQTAIDWWTKTRSKGSTKYISPHGATEEWSMWFPPAILEKLSKIADEDSTNTSLVINTALVLYFETVVQKKPMTEVIGIPDYTPAYQRAGVPSSRVVKSR